MEKKTTKSYIATLDIEKTRESIKRHREEKEKMREKFGDKRRPRRRRGPHSPGPKSESTDISISMTPEEKPKKSAKKAPKKSTAKPKKSTKKTAKPEGVLGFPLATETNTFMIDEPSSAYSMA